MSEDRSFRKAAFGGFNRKDVIDYIEQLLIEQAENRKALVEKDEQLAALKEQLAALNSKMADMEDERGSASSVITDEDDPDTVLKKVDSLLKSYLGAEAEE